MSYHPYKASGHHVRGVKGPAIRETPFRKGDVVFAEKVEYDDGSGSKGRPVVYLGGDWKTARYAKCTSADSERYQRIRIGDPISAGLDRDTYLEPKVRSMGRKNLKYRIGHLCDDDLEYLMETIGR